MKFSENLKTARDYSLVPRFPPLNNCKITKTQIYLTLPLVHHSYIKSKVCLKYFLRRLQFSMLVSAIIIFLTTFTLIYVNKLMLLKTSSFYKWKNQNKRVYCVNIKLTSSNRPVCILHINISNVSNDPVHMISPLASSAKQENWHGRGAVNVRKFRYL